MRGFKLPKIASAALVLLIYCVLCVYFYFSEGYISNGIFMMALGGAIIGGFVLITKRPLFSTVLFGSMVVVIAVVAYVKHQEMTLALHLWDFIYYFNSWSTVAGWWHGRPLALAILLAGVLSLTFGSWFAWRLDTPSVRRLWSVGTILAMSGIAWIALSVRGDRPHMLFNFSDWHVSSFFSSFVETSEALMRGGLIEAAPKSDTKPFDSSWSCSPQGKPPNIILIHQESVGPPMFFPDIAYDKSIEPLFKSFDGKIHKLNVETYGGASWLTESGVLLGLSSRFFGSMRDFIQFFMADKLQDSLPQILEKCGYRNTMFYPYILRAFGNKRFFETIGLREVYDRKAQGLPFDVARDRVYYDNMLNFMAGKTGEGQKPLFIFLQTMSAHWPYSITYEPDVKVPDGGEKNRSDMREYLRRLAIAQIDLEYLKTELRQRFPGEQFLILQYGDHHALPTGRFLGYGADADVQNMEIPPGYPYFTTFYSVDGVNYTPPRLSDLDSVDTAYVGAIFLDAARIPLPESWRERLRLMQLCDGKAFECKQRQEILKFHRRLIDSGLMKAR
jgi:phosphoglycerol transferase MdoB-like AlkP superfamily enzyme